MTTIGSVTPSTTSNAAKDNAALIGDYETFLTILTTQLQNQDPMEPMDSSEFTNQLVQYSSVEQQIKTNDQLEALTNMITSSNALSALNFVDTTITIDGSKGYLDEYGSVTYTFDADKEGKGSVTIFNESGEIVANYTDVEVTEGRQSFQWDGNDFSGNRMAKGIYSIVVKAETEGGTKVAIQSEVTGEVTDVDLSSSEPMLTVDGQTIKLSQIKSVS